MRYIEDTYVLDNQRRFIVPDVGVRLAVLSSVVLLRVRRALFPLIMILSGFLLFYQFPSLPGGLYWDEVSAGYETYALLLHGTDRWGDRFPPYFPAWGSGQNVLLSYLNIPFIRIFGLTAFGERFSSALLGLLTVGVFYAFIKRWYGTRTALIAAFMLATCPWHIMMSRWSLESNLLPDFLLFGIASLSYCYTSKYSRIFIPFSLLFLAIAFYAYGVAIIIIPIFLMFYFGLISLGGWRNKSIAWANIPGILLSLVIFFVVVLPFLLFILDNYILHATPSIVRHLPFTIPLLPSNRLAQVAGGQNALASNIPFFVSGFSDGAVWDIASVYAPLGLLSLPLVALGIYYSLRKRQIHANLFSIWLVATTPIFFLFPLTTYRANAVYLPFIALCTIGISGLYDSLNKQKVKIAVLSLLLGAITLYNSMFCWYYFTTYNNNVKSTFNAGFGVALMHARSVAAANEPIYISHQIIFNYVYTLFFLKADPVDFQRYARITISGGIYQVSYYRNYYFDPDQAGLTLAPSFVAVLKKDNDRVACERREVILDTEGDWSIVRCFNR